jgi:hypothetical protein
MERNLLRMRSKGAWQRGPEKRASMEGTSTASDHIELRAIDSQFDSITNQDGDSTLAEALHVGTALALEKGVQGGHHVDPQAGERALPH